jgi:nucleotide-binding universal stress UspA family protein
MQWLLMASFISSRPWKAVLSYRGKKDLDFAKSIVKKDEIPCETHLSVRGMPPGEDLVEYAKEKQIDQIVVGIRRRSKVGKLVFGSTAQYVILEAPCPVLTVK